MNPSDDSPKRELFVDTKTPATEITLIDSTGQVLAKFVRKLSSMVPPGLYKIRYRVGDRVVDQLIEVPPGEGRCEVAVPPLPILSAAPLPDAEEKSSAVFAAELIARGSPDPTDRASLFIFISADTQSSNDPSDLPQTTGSGISIHTFSGQRIGDLEDAERRNGCCGKTFPVEPGNYILRVEMPPGRPVEQTLVAVDGWQLQFYARMVKKEDRSAETTPPATTESSAFTPRFTWQLDLGRSGVLLVREPSSKPTSLDQMRWTAAARQALAAGRLRAAPDQEMIDSLLREKFDNPMLGIYAGHLLAMQDEPNQDLLREVVNNMIGVVGQHPDLTPLLITLKDSRAGKLLYKEPPMLRRSWAIIVQASTPQKDLRAAGSYAACIGGSLWGGGAWLAWRQPVFVKAEDASQDLFPTLYSRAVSGALAEPLQRLMQPADDSKLTPVEALVAHYLDVASKQFTMAQKFSVEDDQQSWYSGIAPLIRPIIDSGVVRDAKRTFTSANMMKLTGLPYSSIKEASSSLASKLGVTAAPSFISQVKGALRFK